MIPQSLGYAKLAGLPVQYGLYTSFMGGVVYWLFATSKDITIGVSQSSLLLPSLLTQSQPVAVMSTVVGTIITEVHEDYPDIPAPQIALSITIICGSIVAFMGLARLGFIVDFIPLPSITSFMTGSAITICAGQVKPLLGEKADFDTRSPAYQIIIDTLKNLPSSSRYDATMGIAALATLYTIRAACDFSAARYPRVAKLFFFLSALRTVFVILLFTLISGVVNMHRRDDPAFAIVGYVPRGFQHAGVPIINTKGVISTIASRLPACVIVLLLEHIAISKSFGRINNYTINPSQELIAIGVTNLLGPFVGAYSATGSFSRSAIQSKSGSRTPLTGIVTAIIVLVAMYALTPVLYYIPHASLSGVIIHAVGDLIVAPRTLYQYWRIAPLDVFIFAVGLIVAIANTIPDSIYITVGLSVAILLFRHAKAPGEFLAWSWIGEQDTQRRLYLPTNGSDISADQQFKLQHPRPGVFVYRFSEGFNYPNAGHYSDILVQTIHKHTRRTNAQAFRKKGDRPWNDPDPDTREDSVDEGCLPPLRAVILDFSAVNNVDMTSIQNLIDLRDQFNRRAAPIEVQWHFAHVGNRWTRRALAAAGFGYPSRCTSSAVLDDENAEGSVSPAKDECDMEIGEEKQSCKRCRKHLDTPDSSVGGDMPGSVQVALGNIERPFFHVDLTSALESVDAYIAAHPV